MEMSKLTRTVYIRAKVWKVNQPFEALVAKRLYSITSDSVEKSM